MRNPRALSRAVSHPSGDSIRRRVPAPSNPPAAGKASRPVIDRAEPGTSSLADATGVARGVPSGAGTVALVTTGLVAAMGLVALLTSSAQPHGVALMCAFLTVVGVLVQRPRTADRALASLVGALILPALLVIALAVRLSGPGPVLVRQERPHSGHPSHPALRFRTTTTTAASSDRSTPVGRLLRALSLDELPGLFDVMRGEVPFLRCR